MHSYKQAAKNTCPEADSQSPASRAPDRRSSPYSVLRPLFRITPTPNPPTTKLLHPPEHESHPSPGLSTSPSLNLSRNMQQRATYGRSPPLHHPVPQHVSTVPQLRSPPPPTSQPQGGYDGSPYQPQPQQQQGGAPGGPNVFGQYGNFMNDPAAQLASQFGQTAFRQGQEYIEQNVRERYSPAPYLPSRRPQAD